MVWEILISNALTQNPPKVCFLSFFQHRPHNHPQSLSDSSSSKGYHSNCFWKMETSISEQWPNTIVITHPCHRIFFLYTLALILARFLQIGVASNTPEKGFLLFLRFLWPSSLKGSHYSGYNQIHWQGKHMFSCGQRCLPFDLEK